MSEKKKCFIITPIDDEKSETRRHIEGIIEAAITPVVKDEFEYEIEVAHRIDAPGNIPKQVILEVFSCDLAIANLTGKNPNVMYELALRHCFGKPVIIIAQEGTNLPADVTSERTIFYVNDALGVIDLRNRLRNTVKSIEEGKTDRLGPIYEALKTELKESTIIREIKETEGEEEANIIKYLIAKIDALQLEIRKNNTYFEHANMRSVRSETHIIKVRTERIISELTKDEKDNLRDSLLRIPEVVSLRISGTLYRVGLRTDNDAVLNVLDEIERVFHYYKIPIQDVTWHESV